MKHLLVTNDFPPKVGGIQNYLWELWRRLPPDDVVVLTTPYAGTAEWDREQAFRVVRSREPVLLPQPWLARRIDQLASEVGAELVVLDPALPVGLVGPWLKHPYGLVLHGAEVTVPGRVPFTKPLLSKVLRDASVIIAAGGYPAAEGRHAAGRDLPIVHVPPGVDIDRFHPRTDARRAATRAKYGIPTDALMVLGQSRLVPRKGFDVLLRAAATLAGKYSALQVVIGGSGRDRARLEKVAKEAGAPAIFLGRVPEEDLAAMHGAADVFAMLCRNRWGGLEQEGFGIVFLEAAASGVPQLAGRSGGAAEAVVDNETGLIVDNPNSVADVADALDRLLADGHLRATLGKAARQRAEEVFTYDTLALRLAEALGCSRA
jgi:phosphatidyl-myo-inositol dimannoside synthase